MFFIIQFQTMNTSTTNFFLFLLFFVIHHSCCCFCWNWKKNSVCEWIKNEK
jgi:hypothetical protein